jgi:hypothetical protein
LRVPPAGIGGIRGGPKTIVDALNQVRNLGRTRNLWTLTREGASTIKYHKLFGTFYKSKSDNLWWSVDKTGHGGSQYKVFKETNKGLEWYKDADEYGTFLSGKHKGPTGLVIPWKQLGKVK